MVKIRYLKIGMLLECAVLAFLGIFYFSCGEALYMRESDGCVAEFPATGEIGELTDGILAEQIFTSQMDRMDAVGVLVSNYGRAQNSSLLVRVEDAVDGRLIAQRAFPAGELGIGQYVWLDTGGLHMRAAGWYVLYVRAMVLRAMRLRCGIR